MAAVCTSEVQTLGSLSAPPPPPRLTVPEIIPFVFRKPSGRDLCEECGKGCDSAKRSSCSTCGGTDGAASESTYCIGGPTPRLEDSDDADTDAMVASWTMSEALSAVWNWSPMPRVAGPKHDPEDDEISLGTYEESMNGDACFSSMDGDDLWGDLHTTCKLDRRKQRRHWVFQRGITPQADDEQKATPPVQSLKELHEAQNAAFAAKFNHQVQRRRGAIWVKSPMEHAPTECSDDSGTDSHGLDEVRKVESENATVAAPAPPTVSWGEMPISSTGSDWFASVIDGASLFAKEVTDVPPSALQARSQKRLDRIAAHRAEANAHRTEEASVEHKEDAPQSDGNFFATLSRYMSITSQAPAQEDDEEEGEYHNIWGDDDTEELVRKRMKEFRRRKLALGL
mmetsp:Transcript_28591/g.66245  ORF Transcript_28591/g.66245 Transcript_28591/m.66245 type:complete len:397 (+) Transcript_28591:91-1281(+)